MKLVNGTNQAVKFAAADIKREAGFDTGMTSIVFATCKDGAQVSLSQHESGDWDISVDEEPLDSFDDNQGDFAVAEFIRIVQSHNS